MESHFQLLRRRGKSWKHRGEEKTKKTTGNIGRSCEGVFNAQTSITSRSSPNHSTHGISSNNEPSNRCVAFNQFGNGSLNQCGTSFSGSFAVAVGTCLNHQPGRISVLTSKPVDIDQIGIVGSLSRADRLYSGDEELRHSNRESAQPSSTASNVLPSIQCCSANEQC